MIPGYKEAKPSFFPRSARIVHHKKHSYDEHGYVIVVDDSDEDRQEFVNSFKDSVGLKNILRQLALTGQGISPTMAYNPDVDAVDNSLMPETLADLQKAAENGDQVIRDAVKSFNETYGTSYTVEEFIKKSADGSLITDVSELLSKKDKEKDGDDNG